jgi:hypothetical protein
MAAKRNKTSVEVFLSHAHEDAALMKRLAKVLRDRGIAVWYSEHHIKGAQKWLDEIGVALDRCDWFVVILTPASVNSKWVKRELTYALNEDRFEGRLVPLLAKDCDYKKLAWPLSTLQIIPFKRFPSGCKALLDIWKIKY